jgi:hypothetical protein
MSDDTAHPASAKLDQPPQPIMDGGGTVRQVNKIADGQVGAGGSNGGAAPTPPGNGLPPQTLFWVAVLILVAFLGFSLFMILNADASDPVWKNRLAIFTVLQAIVYTAVGWLFGREVNRGAKEAAEKSADVANADADRAKAEAADAKEAERQQAAARATTLEAASAENVRGAALAAAVLVGSTARAVPTGIENQSASAAPRDTAADPVRAMAARLYPELTS